MYNTCFEHFFEIGILQELHSQGLLSKAQMERAIEILAAKQNKKTDKGITQK